MHAVHGGGAPPPGSLNLGSPHDELGIQLSQDWEPPAATAREAPNP